MDDNSQVQQGLESEELKKQLAAAQLQQDRLLQAMLCASSEMVVVMDRQGRILDANAVAVQRLGRSLEAIRGVCVYDLFDPQTGSRRKAMHEEVCQSRQSLFYEDHRNGRTIENHLYPIIGEDGEIASVVVFAKDITEHRQKEDTLAFIRTLLQICQDTSQIQTLLDQSVREIRRFTGCQAAGIRLLDKGGNIPYQAYEGFSREFYNKESPLSIQRDDCMCIQVIEGKTDPSKPFFTPFGSFYMNGTSAFLAAACEQEKGKTRNVCNEYGYETVALVPIRNQEKILGLIHLADTQTGMMPQHRLEAVETAALQLATTILHIQSQVRIQDEKELAQKYLDIAASLIVALDVKGNISLLNKEGAEILECDQDTAIGKNWFNTFVPAYEKERLDRVFRAVLDGQTKYSEYVNSDIITFRGSIKTIRWHNRIFHDVEGAIIGTLYAGEDITEKKNAENALRESEAKFRTVFDASPVGMALLRPDGYFLLVNEAFCRMLGYSSQEMLRLTYADITLPQDVPANRLQVQALLDGQERQFSIEKRYVHKNGSVIWAMVNVGLVRDTAEKPSYFIAQIQDITARKRAEEQLRFQAAILDQIQDHITATDMDGYITYVNQPEQAFLGANAESLIGKHVSMYGENSEQRATQQDIIANTQKFGKWRCEIVNYTPDGRAHLMDCRTQVLYDTNGQPAGMVGVSTDITERKQIEKQLQESEERYRALVEFSPSAVVVLQDRNYVWANAKALELLGVRQVSDLAGADVMRFVSPEFQGIAYAWIVKAEQGEMVAPLEIQAVRADGGKFWVEARVAPIHLQGQPAILVVADDITHRKTAELQRQAYQSKLKALVTQLTVVEETERKRIAAELHDRIGQSLVFAKMKYDLLAKTLADVQQKTAAEEIGHWLGAAIRETQTLTYNLGSVTLYERGLSIAIQEWIDEDYVCRHPVRVHFQHEMSSRLKDHIELFIFRTVRELLINAAKHAQAGQVTIALIETDGCIRLTVQDDGIGYETSIRRKHDKPQKHFGLLSIRERLDYMNGTMDIVSHPDKGTTITIVVPIGQSDRIENKQLRMEDKQQ